MIRKLLFIFCFFAQLSFGDEQCRIDKNENWSTPSMVKKCMLWLVPSSACSKNKPDSCFQEKIKSLRFLESLGLTKLYGQEESEISVVALRHLFAENLRLTSGLEDYEKDLKRGLNSIVNPILERKIGKYLETQFEEFANKHFIDSKNNISWKWKVLDDFEKNFLLKKIKKMRRFFKARSLSEKKFLKIRTELISEINSIFEFTEFDLLKELNSTLLFPVHLLFECHKDFCDQESFKKLFTSKDLVSLRDDYLFLNDFFEDHLPQVFVLKHKESRKTSNYVLKSKNWTLIHSLKTSLLEVYDQQKRNSLEIRKRI
jgi:hypothetical protein